MSNSTVADLRAEIARECEASWQALYGLASGSAQHAFISARLHQMETCHQQLSALIGEEQATDLLCEVFEQAGEAFVVANICEVRTERLPVVVAASVLTPLRKVVLVREGRE